MSYPDNPHLKLPFRITGNKAEVVEQDTAEEIAQCVEVVLSYPVGLRIDLPDFGINDQTFREQGPDVDEIRTAILRWEPRADATVDPILYTDDISGSARVQLREGGN